MTAAWVNEQFFYHIYPLGFCGAPRRNDFHSAPVHRLEKIYGWLDHLQNMGITALYLGPLFESSAHGYDTADYYHVDRRLGSDDTLSALSAELHRRGMRLVLDGVFNHVGRDFWGFRDVLQNGQNSGYRGWFEQLDFSGRSPYGDPFSYEGWSGNYDLVKLNLRNSHVRQHLFDAVTTWVEAFGVDGLRLDAADVLLPEFLDDLSRHCRSLRSDLWLMGEIVHGDYRRLAAPGRLDAVTNYEGYKSLYSSHVDRNYFELAYSLNRQSGPQGIYRDIGLYTFADNHDVNRVASNLKDSRHLYTLYLLLLTMPGIPSLYYGSEWGITGTRTPYNDVELRPALEISDRQRFPHPDLDATIARFAQVRRHSSALQRGDYLQLLVAAQQLAFLRILDGEQVVVIANAADAPVPVDLNLPFASARLVDRLNPGDTFEVRDHKARVDPVPAFWGRILTVEYL